MRERYIEREREREREMDAGNRSGLSTGGRRRDQRGTKGVLSFATKTHTHTNK